MKVHLLYRDRDFDFSAKTPPVVADLVQDLELQRVFAAMALGDQYLLEVSSQVVWPDSRILARSGTDSRCCPTSSPTLAF